MHLAVNCILKIVQETKKKTTIKRSHLFYFQEQLSRREKRISLLHTVFQVNK